MCDNKETWNLKKQVKLSLVEKNYVDETWYHFLRKVYVIFLDKLT